MTTEERDALKRIFVDVFRESHAVVTPNENGTIGDYERVKKLQVAVAALDEWLINYAVSELVRRGDVPDLKP